MRPAILVILIACAATLAGCISTPGGELEPADATLDEGVLDAAPQTEHISGSILASAGTPARTVNYGGEFAAELPVGPGFNGVVIELEWEPTSAANEALSVWVRDAGAGNLPPDDPMELVMPSEPLARAEGSGPLRLALVADMFPSENTYEIIVRATSSGVAVEQPFSLHVTTFEDVAFDEGYTALGE